jgi:ABC-2 type transport system ATP-binding protein
MKQKLNLARALLSNPPVLLLDEPTRSLDPAAQQDFQDLVRKELVDKLGTTVLLITHNLEEARRICDRVALLENGTIARIWPAAKLPTDWGKGRADAPGARKHA